MKESAGQVMRIQQTRWEKASGWTSDDGTPDGGADLVLYFGCRAALKDEARFHELRGAYPTARILGCSATRSIAGESIDDNCIAAVALKFGNTPIEIAQRKVSAISESRKAGQGIGSDLLSEHLAGIFVLADGLKVDGSELVAGISDIVGSSILVVGGMASDGSEYTETLVGADGVAQAGMVAAIGFYGKAIRFGYGSASGWEAFGPRRKITRANGNVIHELDDKPAFELFQRYIGEDAANGVSTVVTLPLQISDPDDPERTTVRSLLSVDNATGSMTFGGHTPEGWVARLMRGNLDRLILGAGDAARVARVPDADLEKGESLAIVVSCAGRLLTMGQRTYEEIEVAGEELGSKTKRIGFYSNGEISPLRHSGFSEIHNQTMTITTLFEEVF